MFWLDWIRIDFETRAICDLSDVGAYRYFEDPATEVLLGAYAVKKDPIKLWAPWAGFETYAAQGWRHPAPGAFRCPRDLEIAVLAGVPICAHNAQFERTLWEKVLTPRYGWPLPGPNQWRCSAYIARYNGLPGKLSEAAKVANLPIEKGSTKLMLKMCKPRPHWSKQGKGAPWFCSVDQYRQLGGYCIRDVEVEDALLGYCIRPTALEDSLWAMDQEMNRTGIPMDLAHVRAASHVHEVRFNRAASRLKYLTSGYVDAPSKAEKLREWVSWRLSQSLPDLAKGTVDKLLADQIPADVREALELRKSAGASATAKYITMLDRVSADGYLRGEIIHYGAHTGRAASNGVQVQNTAKYRMDPLEAEKLIPAFVQNPWSIPNLDDFLTTTVRSSFCAPLGWVFIDFDLAQIEARMIAWMAGQEELIQAFVDLDQKRTKYDVYQQIAAEVYGIPVESVTKKHRALGKVMILGLGYGMGVERFFHTAIDWGVSDMTMELADKAVKLYRSKYPKIKDFWYKIDDMVKLAMLRGISHFDRYTAIYDRSNEKLTIILPNLRPLFYHRCRMNNGSVEYWGKMKPPKSGYGMVYSWGGKFTENFDQGMSRDIIYQAIHRVWEKYRDCRLLFTVHDEGVWMVQQAVAAERVRQLKIEMEKIPMWAQGLPVAASAWPDPGYRQRFFKD